MLLKRSALVFLIPLLLHACAPPGVVAGNIIYPWRATSAIVKAGDGFCIWYNNVTNAMIDSVRLLGPFHNVALDIDSISVARFEFDSYTLASVNNRIWVHVPRSAPAELYDLAIHGGIETDVSYSSVQVLAQYNPSHCFIHISDLHVSRQWQGSAENGYAKELELLDSFIKVANIIAPDFIIITGDNIHHYTRLDADSTGWGGRKLYDAEQRPLVEEKYAALFSGAKGFSGLHDLQAPLFIATGNHDFYGVPSQDHLAQALQWNALCGLRVYGFSFAGTRVIVADDFLGDPEIDIPDKNPMSGLQGKKLAAFLAEEGPGRLRIMAQHRPDRIDTAFINRNRINILLNGHRHEPFQEYVGATPTLSIRPGTVCKSGTRADWKKELGLFRIFYIQDSVFTVTPPLRFCQDPTVPYRELRPNLTATLREPNDGSVKNNKATLCNRLPVALPRCHIRFIMKKGKYVVTGGTVEKVIQTDRLTLVDVRTPVPSGETKTIAIREN